MLSDSVLFLDIQMVTMVKNTNYQLCTAVSLPEKEGPCYSYPGPDRVSTLNYCNVLCGIYK